jgi:16S rRNA (uracil1498-N3)-methyltransferase
MTLPRFFAPDLSADREFFLPAEEAHHLTRVLRLRAKDEVAVFDGRGAEYRARIESASRDRVLLRTLEPLPTPVPPPVAVTLVQAILKGHSMDDVVRDATMMGVVAIVPVLSEHVDVKPSLVTRDSTLERWRRVTLASVKQSRRATIPAIEAPKALAAVLGAMGPAEKLVFVEPSLGGEVRSLRSVFEATRPEELAVLIGPEGGWSREEAEACIRTGCLPVSLGTNTIRAESMPLAALAAILALSS